MAAVVKKELSQEAKQLLYYFTGLINNCSTFIHDKKYCVITEWPLKYLAIQNDGVINPGQTVTYAFDAFYELMNVGYKIESVDGVYSKDIIIYVVSKEITENKERFLYIAREFV